MRIEETIKTEGITAIFNYPHNYAINFLLVIDYPADSYMLKIEMRVYRVHYIIFEEV
jgi:hypothetical protein